MKVKICNLLRATVYLQFMTAICTMAWIIYDTFLHTDLHSENIFSETLIVAAALQAVYAISIMRLIHQYAPSLRVPSQSFFQFYKVLVGINAAVGVSLLIWMGSRFVSLWQLSANYGISNPLQWLEGCIVGSYAIVSIYTIAGAAKLKKAILQRREWQIEVWLEEVGQLSAA